MKTNEVTITRYDADEGKVFDWANLEEHIAEDGTQEHLNAKTIFVGTYDTIDNYVEVDVPMADE